MVFSWFLCIVPRSFSSFFSYFLFLCILQGIKTQDRATIVSLFLFFKILCFNIFYVFFFYHFSKGVEIKLFSANFFSWNILGYKEEEKRKQVRHFLMPDMKFFFFLITLLKKWHVLSHGPKIILSLSYPKWFFISIKHVVRIYS